MSAIRTCLIDKYCVFSGRAPRSEFCAFLAWCVFLACIFKTFGAVVLFLPLAGVTVRRLHDCGLSGHVLLTAFLASILLAARVPLLSTLAGCVLFVIGSVLVFIKGTDGPNAFGEDPLHAASPAHARRQAGKSKSRTRSFFARCSSKLHALLHGRPTCPNCSAYVAAEDRFCKTCGSDLKKKGGKTCPDCGAALEDDGFYCPKCGARVR